MAENCLVLQQRCDASLLARQDILSSQRGCSFVGIDKRNRIQCSNSETRQDSGMARIWDVVGA